MKPRCQWCRGGNGSLFKFIHLQLDQMADTETDLMWKKIDPDLYHRLEEAK
jgi:hypothetical protein